jgi:hypothetical protein
MLKANLTRALCETTGLKHLCAEAKNGQLIIHYQKPDPKSQSGVQEIHLVTLNLVRSGLYDLFHEPRLLFAYAETIMNGKGYLDCKVGEYVDSFEKMEMIHEILACDPELSLPYFLNCQIKKDPGNKKYFYMENYIKTLGDIISLSSIKKIIEYSTHLNILRIETLESLFLEKAQKKSNIPPLTAIRFDVIMEYYKHAFCQGKFAWPELEPHLDKSFFLVYWKMRINYLVQETRNSTELQNLIQLLGTSMGQPATRN